MGFGAEDAEFLRQLKPDKTTYICRGVNIILVRRTGRQYRESALQRYRWRIQRKAELEEEEREHKLEAERA